MSASLADGRSDAYLQIEHISGDPIIIPLLIMDLMKIRQALQCHDTNGPKIPPDVFSGEDARTWPQEELAVMYHQKLASTNSARRVNGRHYYASGCHHFNLPPTCWVLDPMND